MMIRVLMCAACLMWVGCDKKAPQATQPTAPPAPGKAVKPAPAAKAEPAKTLNAKPAAKKAPTSTSAAAPTKAPAPAGPVEVKRDTAKNLVLSVQKAAAAQDMASVAKMSTRMSARGVMRFPPARLAAAVNGTITEVKVNGGREVVVLKDGNTTKHVVTYKRNGVYELDLMKTMRWQDVNKGEADPLNTVISIEEATKGIAGSGKLYTKIATSLGTFNCELYEKRTPITVANFVGLARGLRGFKDPKTGKWAKRKFYDGLVFHRVIPNFMIQGGDPQGNGSGGPGFTFEDEFHLDLRHDKGGLLSMANRGPNTNGSQFFVTEKATPWLDDGHTIFGACAEADLVKKITGVPKDGSRPKSPITITSMTFHRK